jgi:hypothetical protein
MGTLGRKGSEARAGRGGGARVPLRVQSRGADMPVTATIVSKPRFVPAAGPSAGSSAEDWPAQHPQRARGSARACTYIILFTIKHVTLIP